MTSCSARKPLAAAMMAACLTLGAACASAADWSDTYLNYRYGTKFRESFVNSGPNNNDPNDITKNIIGLNHSSGYKYGVNVFTLDFLMSNKNDPANCQNFQCQGEATEAYVFYRNTLDIGKITDKDFHWGWVRGIGATAGFDLNTKSDAGYNSKKRMFVLGPAVMFDTPGYVNMSLLAVWDSNAPCTTFPPAAVGYPSNCIDRYHYKTHPMLWTAWGIPIGSTGFSFEGYLNLIASKGKNEFGAETKPETNFDGQIMYDLGRLGLGPRGTFKVGFEYQYWKNKFGNDHTIPGPNGAGPGAFAKTPMVRAEYHF
ncbi:MAG TPA: outer envelope protein [Burkholderiales bacterium]|nr:outer envelope protein [Burkholderiales bacterium]